nr:PREDICTED: vacuolar protein sorting-associated protein 33A [Bemisia tabaci]
MSYLSRGKINIQEVQENSWKELLQLLEKCVGTKAIVWDEPLADAIGSIAMFSLLRDQDVVKMFPLRRGRLPIGQNPLTVYKNIIFITRPQVNLMDMIADNIHGEERTSGPHKMSTFHLFFVPNRSLLCEQILKNRGVYGNFTFIEEFACTIFPFDYDLLSMELDSAFKELHLESDPSYMYQAAQAIMMLQDLYGVIPRVSGKGLAAKHVWDLLKRLSLEPRTPKKHITHSQIDHLLLLDRSIDLVSPLVTQLTYEGLIDELFQINRCTVHLPPEKFSHSNEDQKDVIAGKKQIILNSADDIFAELRDKNFNAVGSTLNRRAKLISSQLDERHGDRTVQEMKQFVDRLPKMLASKKSLAIHTTVAELIKETADSSEFLDSLMVEQDMVLGVDTDKINPRIEECIAKKVPLVKVLRLICLQSATNSGLKPKILDFYKREIIQTYGFEHIISLTNLEKCGLLKVQSGQRQFMVVRKTLRLTIEDCDEINPTDINYVHSIYAPLSVRLAQHATKPNGWANLQDSLQLLSGPVVDHHQNIPPSQLSQRNNITSQNDAPKVVLVFFLGGCTYAEISALRFLSQQEESNVEFIIATTKIINGNSFIKSLMEPLVPES